MYPVNTCPVSIDQFCTCTGKCLVVVPKLGKCHPHCLPSTNEHAHGAAGSCGNAQQEARANRSTSTQDPVFWGHTRAPRQAPHWRTAPKRPTDMDYTTTGPSGRMTTCFAPAVWEEEEEEELRASHPLGRRAQVYHLVPRHASRLHPRRVCPESRARPALNLRHSARE